MEQWKIIPFISKRDQRFSSIGTDEIPDMIQVPMLHTVHSHEKHLEILELIAKAPETLRQRDALLEACKEARKWFEDLIECKPRPTGESAIVMQSVLHEAIVSAYASVEG